MCLLILLVPIRLIDFVYIKWLFADWEGCGWDLCAWGFQKQAGQTPVRDVLGLGYPAQGHGLEHSNPLDSVQHFSIPLHLGNHTILNESGPAPFIIVKCRSLFKCPAGKLQFSRKHYLYLPCKKKRLFETTVTRLAS